MPRRPTAKAAKYVVASDASKGNTPISDKLPSTQIGFLKVSHVLIEMEKYAGLVQIHPTGLSIRFESAEMHRSASPVTFTMPGSNIRYKVSIASNTVSELRFLTNSASVEAMVGSATSWHAHSWT